MQSEQTCREQAPAHAHYFEAITSVHLQHQHRMRGFTYSVNGSALDGHVHTFQGESELSRGHFHRFYGTTGPAIPLPNGAHYHAISGRVFNNYLQSLNIILGGAAFTKGVQYSANSKDVHAHDYKGSTGVGIGYEPTLW